MKNKSLVIFLSSLASLMVGILLAIFVLPRISKIVVPWGTREIITTMAVFAIVLSISSPIISHLLTVHKENKEKNTVYLIDINITPLQNNYVQFSASIHNVGDVQIKTLVSNLYIDQGFPVELPNDYNSDNDSGLSYYKFPFILEHKKMFNNRPDCVLCTKCFREMKSGYPEEYIEQEFKAKKDAVRTHYALQHLSEKSIMYINPKEKFSEDVIVHFTNSGVYRVTLFVGAADTADCSCATKQFYIPSDYHSEPNNNLEEKSQET